MNEFVLCVILWSLQQTTWVAYKSERLQLMAETIYSRQKWKSTHLFRKVVLRLCQQTVCGICNVGLIAFVLVVRHSFIHKVRKALEIN